MPGTGDKDQLPISYDITVKVCGSESVRGKVWRGLKPAQSATLIREHGTELEKSLERFTITFIQHYWGASNRQCAKCWGWTRTRIKGENFSGPILFMSKETIPLEPPATEPLCPLPEPSQALTASLPSAQWRGEEGVCPHPTPKQCGPDRDSINDQQRKGTRPCMDSLGIKTMGSGNNWSQLYNTYETGSMKTLKLQRSITDVRKIIFSREFCR